MKKKTTDFRQPESLDARIDLLLSRMTVAEKIGQMCQVNRDSVDLHQAVKDGRVGSVLNLVDIQEINHLQKLATEESRLGIPLLIGRDVIHGFKTIFPIPLGQAASWNPELVSEGARIAALEAASVGINWTFSPMIDITRDPRWGRIAESLGEDPFLCKALAIAMVDGYQGDDLAVAGSIAACAKHFAGYGASESGRDYNTVSIPEIELRNVYLPPFKAAADAGVATFMTAFSELNGVPATANEFLLRQILRTEWGFQGLVVSDWDSIPQMTTHGLTATDKEAAFEAVSAGVNMEMASSTYADHLQALIGEGRISETDIDAMVAAIVRVKFRLGLFENPITDTKKFPAIANTRHLEAARQAAVQSCVLLKNDRQLLPLSLEQPGNIAVIGPLADQAQEQLGTWVFDGDPRDSQTGLQGVRTLLGERATVLFSKGLEYSRSKSREGFTEAVYTAQQSDVVIMFAGEEAILSGEAHCRASIDLPGCQEELIDEIAATGKPIVLVIMAGRPLTLGSVLEKVDAVLYAWHPGSMGGPAIADLLFGNEVPSGKLPVTFPRMVGQIPIYHAKKNTGKPACSETFVHIDDIAINTPQTSTGMTAMHLDAGFSPLFPFGYGLSYTEFKYENISTSADTIGLGETVQINAKLTNTGTFTAEEVAQLYIRDLVGSVTRPVRELKGFKKIRLKPGQSETVSFEIHTDDLAFHNRHMRFGSEPGLFHAWIGGDSNAELRTGFTISA
ncbi:MAG: glycoside hydrolase family 3 N-terminal domain-containing protein [Lysobacterales bacterium]